MVNHLLNISAIIILLSILLSTYRFIKGPTCFDRIAAFDTMSISTISLIVLISMFSDRIIYLDIAIIYGLLSFLGVIIISKYLENTL